MDLEAELLKTVPKEELERQASEKIESFHGFLTREVAIRLIAKEKGLLKVEDKECRLSEVQKGGKRIMFSASVKKVWPVATYSSGKKSRVIEVEDDTGAKPLILWNADVDLAKTLRARDRVMVKGAYEKNGELHLGYSGSLEVLDKATFSDIGGLEEGAIVHVRGVVSKVEGHDSFVRGGRAVRGFSFIVTDGKGERRCVIFEGLGRADAIHPEDEIIIETADVHNGNIEIGEHTRVLTRRSREMLLGEITEMDCSDDTLSVRVGGKDALFERASALKFLGVEAAPDIALSTVVDLKKGSLLNSRIALRVEQRDGKTVVR